MMVFVLLYLPCLATTTSIRKETGSYGWMFFSIGYSTTVAWGWPSWSTREAVCSASLDPRRSRFSGAAPVANPEIKQRIIKTIPWLDLMPLT